MDSYAGGVIREVYQIMRCRGFSNPLSLVYDIVNSKLVLPEEQEETCLSLQGKKNRLTVSDFYMLADHFGLTRKQAENPLSRLYDLKSNIKTEIGNSYLRSDLKENFLKIFDERLARLFT